MIGREVSQKNMSGCCKYCSCRGLCFCQTAHEWRIVFFIAAGIYCAGAVFYVIFASGEKQDWAEVPVGYQSQLDTGAPTETAVEHEDLR